MAVAASQLTDYQGAEGKLGQAQDWWKKNVEGTVHSAIGKLPVIGGLDQMINGTGAMQPLSTAPQDQAAANAANLAGGFAGQYGSLTPTQAPTMQAATIDQTQSNQSRGIQGSGLGTMNLGVGYQQAGAGVQAAGLGTQNQGIGIQQQGLGALNMGLGTQQQGLGAQQRGLGTVSDAAASYRDVLSGKTPSVANLEAQKLQGQNIASMFGGAASARGVDRAGALRAAINGAGAANTQGAADAAINTAREQDAARSGLLGAGQAQSGIGSGITGTGTAMGGIGQGISGVGQGITAGGQGISATGQGLSQTGAGIVNSGTQQTGAGTAIRNLDLSSAANQADLNQAANANNLNSQLTTHGQDITQQNNLGNLTLGAAKNVNDANQLDYNQQVSSQKQAESNNNGVLGLVGGLVKGIWSDERVKTDVAPAGKESRELFAAIVPKKWRYDGSVPEPETKGRDHLGVMAQDVERSGKLGRGMVSERGGVKSIDIPMAVSALMAAVADMSRDKKRKAA